MSEDVRIVEAGVGNVPFGFHGGQGRDGRCGMRVEDGDKIIVPDDTDAGDFFGA